MKKKKREQGKPPRIPRLVVWVDDDENLHELDKVTLGVFVIVIVAVIVGLVVYG